VNSNGTQYSTGEHLGSPRVITSSSGSVVSRHDYMPFGEELGAGTGGRTTGMGFSNSGDNNRKKFTGYERDNETGLDFAQARYNSSTLGRFASPDPFSGSMSTADPQSFNRYAYVGNNPANAADPTGLERDGPGGSLPGAEGAIGRLTGTNGIDPTVGVDPTETFKLSGGSQLPPSTQPGPTPSAPTQPQPATPAAPPPFDSSLAGSPLFVQQNPIPIGITYSYSSVQTLVNQNQTYADGTTSSDQVTGVIMNVAISVVGEDGPITNFTLQEIITPDPGQNFPYAANPDPVSPVSQSGIVPDTIGPLRQASGTTAQEQQALNSYLSAPRTLNVTQELYIAVPNRGVVLYGVNRAGYSNVNPNGSVGPVRIYDRPVSITSTIVGRP